MAIVSTQISQEGTGRLLVRLLWNLKIWVCAARTHFVKDHAVT